MYYQLYTIEINQMNNMMIIKYSIENVLIISHFQLNNQNLFMSMIYVPRWIDDPVVGWDAT